MIDLERRTGGWKLKIGLQQRVWSDQYVSCCGSIGVSCKVLLHSVDLAPRSILRAHVIDRINVRGSDCFAVAEIVADCPIFSLLACVPMARVQGQTNKITSVPIKSGRLEILQILCGHGNN